MLEPQNHPILEKWLSDTTCNKYHIKRSVLFENETHIVLKHGSHAEYCGRFSGVQTCNAYAALYLKSDLQEGKGDRNSTLRGGLFGYLKRWEGRINKALVLEDCARMGVVF